jgi:hypothetical protein
VVVSGLGDDGAAEDERHDPAAHVFLDAGERDGLDLEAGLRWAYQPTHERIVTDGEHHYFLEGRLTSGERCASSSPPPPSVCGREASARSAAQPGATPRVVLRVPSVNWHLTARCVKAKLTTWRVASESISSLRRSTNARAGTIPCSD